MPPAWKIPLSVQWLLLSLATALVFILDRFTPLGIGVWLLYIVPVLWALRLRRPPWTFVVLIVCSLLIVLGMIWSPAGNPLNHESLDRALGTTLLWVSVVLLRQRQRVEDALRQSEQRYALATRAGKAGVWEWDLQTDTLHFDACLRDLVGLGEADLLSSRKSWLERVPVEDQHALQEALRAHLDGASPVFENVHRLRRGDGNLRWFLARGIAERAPDGSPVRLVGTITDLTERKLEEDALWQRAEMLRSLNDNLPNTAIYRLGRELSGQNRFYYISAGIERICGLEPEAVLRDARTLAARVVEEDRPAVRAALDESVRNLSVLDLDLRKRTAEGEIKWLHVRAAPRRLADGRVVWDGVEIDITDRKKLELYLLHSRTRLFAQQTALVDLTKSEVFQSEDLTRIVEHLTETAAGLLGIERVSFWRFTPDQAAIRCVTLYERGTGRHTAGMELEAGAYPAYFQALRTSQAIQADTALADPRTRELAPGYLRPLNITALLDVPIVVQGRLVGILCHEQVGPAQPWTPEDCLFSIALANLIALAIAQGERKRAERAAHAASKAKSDFLTRMSHECRTPLNAILGFAELLLLEAGPDQRPALEQILKAGQHLLDLVNEVLDLARIEAGRLDLFLEPVQIDQAVGEVVDLIRPLAERAGIHLQVNLAGAGQRGVRADCRRLRQVLLNLLANAVKYNRAGGSITVAGAEAPGGRLSLGVTDTGEGIPPEKLGRLFTPFERLGAAKGVEGSGLGLAHSKNLVEAMGGTLRVSSVAGTGSTFWVELPEATVPRTREPGGGEPRSPEAPAPRFSGFTILYVEDNPLAVRLVESMLTLRPGIRLLTAGAGAEGLDAAHRQRPDLILLDSLLPDMAGDEFLRRLRSNPECSGLPVICLSGDQSPEVAERYSAAGVAGYLCKPFRLPQFLELVDGILQPAACHS
jgi:PAS domain S-box-containing protein